VKLLIKCSWVAADARVRNLLNLGIYWSVLVQSNDIYWTTKGLKASCGYRRCKGALLFSKKLTTFFVIALKTWPLQQWGPHIWDIEARRTQC